MPGIVTLPADVTAVADPELYHPHIVQRILRTAWQADGSSLLSLFLFLLFVIPARFVFGPLGAAGTPAQLIGMFAALWWAAHRLGIPRARRTQPQPVRRAMLGFSACVLLSYVAATVRPISDVELRSTDRGLLGLCAWLGIVLVSGDLILSRDRLDQLLRRVVMAGGALATMGLVQFQTGLMLTNYLQLPGLTTNGDLSQITARGGLNRPAGTATSPIEFGVVLTMVLPLALHYALADGHRGLFRRWFPVLAIALAIPVSISRSAVICTVVVMAFLVPTWSPHRRRMALVVGSALLGAVFVVVPGILGVILGLFTGIGHDSSAQSRTDSYNIAWAFISGSPAVGRGFGTFLPSYRILDNQYLLSTIELGFVGIASVLLLFMAGIVGGVRVRRRSSEPTTRSLGQAVAAAIAAGAASFAFFDAFSFAITAGMMFAMLGAVSNMQRLQGLGRLDRVTRREAPSSAARPDGGRTEPSAPVQEGPRSILNTAQLWLVNIVGTGPPVHQGPPRESANGNGRPQVPVDGPQLPAAAPHAPAAAPHVPAIPLQLPPVQSPFPPIRPQVPASEPHVPPVKPQVPASEPHVPPVKPQVPASETHVPASAPQGPASETHVPASAPQGPAFNPHLTAAGPHAPTMPMAFPPAGPHSAPAELKVPSAEARIPAVASQVPRSGPEAPSSGTKEWLLSIAVEPGHPDGPAALTARHVACAPGTDQAAPLGERLRGWLRRNR